MLYIKKAKEMIKKEQMFNDFIAMFYCIAMFLGSVIVYMPPLVLLGAFAPQFMIPYLLVSSCFVLEVCCAKQDKPSTIILGLAKYPKDLMLAIFGSGSWLHRLSGSIVSKIEESIVDPIAKMIYLGIVKPTSRHIKANNKLYSEIMNVLLGIAWIMFSVFTDFLLLLCMLILLHSIVYSPTLIALIFFPSSLGLVLICNVIAMLSLAIIFALFDIKPLLDHLVDLVVSVGRGIANFFTKIFSSLKSFFKSQAEAVAERIDKNEFKEFIIGTAGGILCRSLFLLPISIADIFFPSYAMLVIRGYLWATLGAFSLVFAFIGLYIVIALVAAIGMSVYPHICAGVSQAVLASNQLVKDIEPSINILCTKAINLSAAIKTFVKELLATLQDLYQSVVVRKEEKSISKQLRPVTLTDFTNLSQEDKIKNRIARAKVNLQNTAISDPEARQFYRNAIASLEDSLAKEQKLSAKPAQL